jgi:hypothetical protein
VQGLPTTPGPGESLTGFTCPDCHGAIEVVFGGDPIPRLFRCRIGHTFTAAEMLMGKEERIEHLLWTLLTALAEFVALLSDLDRIHEASTTHEEYQNRLRRLERQLAGLRAIIDDNQPTVLVEPDHPLSKEGPR